MFKILDIIESICEKGHKTVVYFRRNGLKMTIARIRQEIFHPGRSNQYFQQLAYESWIERYDTLTMEKKIQIHAEISAWKEKPLLSILMPTYNTKDELLRETIDSGRAQVYQNWELCIADDASPNEELKEYLGSLQADPRIKIVFRKQNGHICEASNSALELCTGIFTVLLDHDDTISPLALYEVAKALRTHDKANVIYSDEDKIDADGKRSMPFFKGDWDPYQLLSRNYISHLGAYRTSLLKEIGGFRKGYEGSQDHDLVLRCALKSTKKQIIHIPRVLYHWRHFSGTGSYSDAYLSKCEKLRRQCVRDFLVAHEQIATISEGFDGYNKVLFSLPEPLPKLSCIILAQNHADLTEMCIQGVLAAKYPNLEVLLVDNGSTEKTALDLCTRYEYEGTVKVIHWNRLPNYSEINNVAAKEASGEYLLFLNNDIKPINPDWLRIMLGYAAQKDVGCVGAKLLFPDNKIQHAGVILGIGVASHAFLYEPSYAPGYFSFAQIPHSVSAVSGACLMTKRDLFFAVGGFNEDDLKIAYNDVDLCLKIMSQGYYNIYVPYAKLYKLYHYESILRGSDYKDESTLQRFNQEQEYMRKHWSSLIENDPYYNPNLTRKSVYCEIVRPDEDVQYDDI